MRVSASLPTGVAAFFFESARLHRELEQRLVSQLESAGFGEVVLPVVDYLEPYEDILNPASRSELYRLVDRDGKVLALRADFTPMLARLIAPRLPTLDLPLRLFYRGDVLRQQEDRAGKTREFYQLGAELLGLPGREAERQSLHQFLTLLDLAAVPARRVVLGFAGALDHLLLECAGPGGDVGELAAAIARRERRAARMASPVLLQIVERGLPDDPEALGKNVGMRLARLVELQAQLAREFSHIELSIDLAEFAEQAVARELRRRVGPRAYYDGLVFKAFAGRAALPVGGGGRYDRMFQRLKVHVTAAGFGFSLNRLLESRGEQGAETVP